MKFDRVRLQNFKCYRDADLRLDAGVTVIHGLNGSGKSSLLEACFFALYGAKALDSTLDDVVTIGEEETVVELWFTHGGESYHARRRIRATGDRAKTAKCELETPDSTVEGVRDVRGHVTELLRMEHDAFLNCAYVRQGEVNKLINASPGDRQDMIDSLLQLGKLEEYRQRASDARVGVGRVRDDTRGALSQLDEQIEAKEEKALHDRLNDLRTKRSKLDDEIDHVETQVEKAQTTRDEATEIVEAYEEKKAEIEQLVTEIDDLEESISATEREREKLSELITERRETRDKRREELSGTVAETELPADPDRETVEQRIETLEANDEDLRDEIEEARLAAQDHANSAESLREKATDLDAEAAENREEAAALETEVEEGRATVSDRREKLSTLEQRIEDARSEFDDAPVEFGEAESFREEVSAELTTVRESIAQLTADVENLAETIEEAEELLEAGKCPECGQDVEESPHVDSIEADRERLTSLRETLEEKRARRDELEERLSSAEALVESEGTVTQLCNDRENVTQLIEEREQTLAEKESQATELREEAEELSASAESKRAEAETAREQADAVREEIATYNQERSAVGERTKRVETVLELLDAIGDDESAIEQHRERRAEKGETNDERKQRLLEKRERRDELREEFDPESVEDAREERDRAVKYLEEAGEKLSTLNADREAVQGQIGGVENEIEELESLRERREGVAARLDRLESLYQETAELEEMYGTLRAQLRQRNVESLERMLNETFDLVYQNDSYARIELSGEYELTVYQKDGEPLDPEQLSGGERALFNLSLRTAIYRLLAEGIEGAAPMPPLILDEPTVFLDSGHVSQLVELVEGMRDHGVDQILVVSHDKELVGAADDLVRVEKDATSNRSTITHSDDLEVPGVLETELLDAD